MVRACRQVLTEVSPIFQRVNNFTFAVASNYRQDIFQSPNVTRKERNLAGTLGMRSHQRMPALVRVSEIRLFDITLRIYSARDIINVRRDIAHCRRSGTRHIQSGVCDALFKVVGQKLAFRLSNLVYQGQPGRMHYPNNNELAEIQRLLQAMVDEVNERRPLDNGLPLSDVIKFARALRFDAVSRETALRSFRAGIYQ